VDAAASAAKNAVRYTIRPGLRVAVIPSVTLTSDVSDVLGADVDIVAGFEYIHEADGQRARLLVSLRSRGGVDVRRIAQALGGNGHVAAAGFRLEANTDPHARPSEHPNPYARIHGVLRDINLVPPRE
jgi:hypothetical protein